MTDTQTPDILVRYVRNTDDSVATGALKWNDDDRPDLGIGEAGYVTERELHQAVALGVTLEATDEEKLRELGVAVPVQPLSPEEQPEPNADLKGATKAKLEEIAAKESPAVDLSEAKNNEERVELIVAARASQPEGTASLPATTGTTPSGGVAPSTTAGSGDGVGTGTSAPA